MCSGASQEGASASKMCKTSVERSETEITGDEDKGEDEGEEEDEDEEEEEFDMEFLLDGVRDPINRLFKMSTKIRNPSTRLGSSRAANCRQIDEETGVDFLEAIKGHDLDYVKSAFLEHKKARARREELPEPPGEPSGENEDQVWEPIRTVLIQEEEREKTGANSYLVERIAQANVRRRQQFAYWAKHRDKLDKNTKAYQAQKGQLRTTQGHKAGEFPSLMELNPGAVPSVSSATRLDVTRLEVPDNRSNWTVSEYAPSTQAAHSLVEFPPAPKTSRKTPSDKFFECPYCFFLCPKEILADKAWKAHLIHDLRPYICTYEDCRNPTQLYDSRRDWVQHENSEHRKVWRCLDHSDQMFERLETYKSHLQEQHAGSISSEASSTRVIQASESVSHIVDRACPICSAELGTSRAMEGHIALHLERFARFSLPRSVTNDDEESNADSDKANKVDEEGSRDDDFEGGFELHSSMDASETQDTERPPEFGSSSPPHGAGATGAIPQDSKALGDDHQNSSESDGASDEVSQSSHDEAASDDFELGEWCKDPEKYAEVEQRYRETLRQKEKELGLEHPDTLASLDDLELLLCGQLKWLEAEQTCRKTLELREKLLGKAHPKTLSDMHSLGFILDGQGRSIEAERIHRETMELREKVLGRESIDTLTSMASLASALYNLRLLEESEKLDVEALESRKKVLGPAHDDTLTSMVNLAMTLGEQGRFEEAEKLEVEAMETRKQILGPAHPDTLLCMSNLAVTLREQGRYEEGEKLDVEVLETRKQKLGYTHPETLQSMNNLAVNWYRQGRIAEAITLMDSCAQFRHDVLGPEHQDTVSSIENLEAWRAEQEIQ